MRSLNTHVHNHYSAVHQKVPCELCGLSLAPMRMKYHLYRKHGIGEIPDEMKTKLCLYCGKKFKQSALYQHINNYHKNNVWRCKICSKEFNNYKTARGHTKYHSITKPWKCFLCDYCSYSNVNVAIHLKKVHKET